MILRTIKTLKDGLILRRATLEDTEAVAKFQSIIHAEDQQTPDERIADWVRDLMSGTHPTFHPDDFTIVEEPSTGKIVSSLCLIDQSWSYAGIPFKVGRPELVATDPAYRNKGLVREQINVVHDWSAQRGQVLQAITGIPYYYRLFGYEMTLELDGGRNAYEFQIPFLKDHEEDPYRFRLAVTEDIPFINAMYHQGSDRSLVNCLRDEHTWEYELNGKRDADIERLWIFIIETPAGEPVGVLIHMNELWGPVMPVKVLEVIPGHPWMSVCQSALRFAWNQGKMLAEKYHQQFDVLGLWLGSNHPAYQALPDRLPKIRAPYNFYIRIPDLPAFLHLIKPELENRLSNSVASGYTGDIPISFYSDGIRFGFEHGKISSIELYRVKNQDAQARFPELTFLQLVFGTKSLAELVNWYPDCSVSQYSDAYPILDALFPPASSNVIPLC